MKTKTYHHPEGAEVEVTFDDLKTQLLETVDEYQASYIAKGYDDEGNTYEATATFVCGELDSIDDIEFTGVNPVTMAKMKQLYDAEVNAGIYDPANPNQSLADKMAEARKLK